MKDLSPKPGDLDPIELASIDEIRALQLDRLRWSLRHAYDNVPMYRAKFDAAGVHPDDLHDLSDLARFPFTLKSDLRENYPFGLFAVPREQIARIHAHVTPHAPIFQCWAKTTLFNIPREFGSVAFLEIETVAHGFEFGKDPVGIL